VHSARLRVSADLMLFRKALLSIEGVLHELGATRMHNDRVLLTDFWNQLCSESFQRITTDCESRDFGTRLSNADLTEAMLSFPWTMSRYWMDETGDLLRRLTKTVRASA